MVSIMTTRELYRAHANGCVVLRVSMETPAWAPQPVLNPLWLRAMLASAMRGWLRLRS